MSSRVRDVFWRLKKSFGVLLLLLIGVLFFGGILFTIQDFTEYLPPIRFLKAATSSNATAILEVGDIAPQLQQVVLNGNTAITLTPNATTAVSVSARIIDQNGCSDITSNVSSTILVYRSGVTSSTCLTTQDNLNCYLATAFTASSTCTTYFVDATATVGIYYFAQPTDASNSPYSSQDWKATVIFRSSQNTTTSADSAGVDLNSMTAIGLSTSSINYGEVSSNNDTGFVNELMGVFNAGNTTSSLSLHGTALTSGSSVIATSSQHYATTTFFYGGSEQQLQPISTAVSGFNLLPRVSLINTLESWSDTTGLPYPRADHVSVFHNGYVYILGGDNGAGAEATATVRYAPVNSDGTIGSWTNTTAMQSPLSGHAAVVANGYIYVFGGLNDASAKTSTVRYSPINSDGTIGSWSNTTAISDAISDHGAVVENGFVYVIGGNTTAVTNVVRYAQINSDGTIGSWTTNSAYYLPSAIRYFSAVVKNKRIYILGGSDVSNVNTTTVKYAISNDDGSLGAWTNATALPVAIRDFSSVVNGDYIYTMGGYLTASGTTTVRYASLATDGSLGSWADTTSLPSVTYEHTSFSNKGYIYVLAGQNTLDGQTSTVRYANIENGANIGDIFWGVDVTGASASAEHSGVTTFTAVYVP